MFRRILDWGVLDRSNAIHKLVVVALGMVLSAACFLDREQAVELRVVDLPVLDSADESVRNQLESAHAELLGFEGANVDSNQRASAYGKLGRLLMAAELLTAAEPALLNAHALAPGTIEWPYLLGHLYRSRGDAVEASAMFEDAVRIAPGDLAARVWLGRLYLDLNRSGAAKAEFVRGVEIAPNNSAAREGLGRAALALGEYMTAVGELERALEIAPEASSVNYQLGLAYRGLGEEALAERHMAQSGDVDVALPDPRMDAVALVLDSALTHQRRGVDAMDAGLWTVATDQFRRGLMVVSEGDNTLRLSLMHKLGSALWLVGNTEAAIEQFEAGIRLSPEFSLNYFSLGAIHASRGNLENARTRIETGITYDPNDVDARIALGNVLQSLNEHISALVHYEHALTVAPDNADARYAQVVALVQLNREAEARQVLIGSLERHPDDQRFTDALAALLGF